MRKKSFWLEEKHAKWIEKIANKTEKTESDVIRGIMEIVLDNPTLKDYKP